MNVNLQDIISKLQTAKGELRKQPQFAKYAGGMDEIITHTSEPLMLMVMGSFSTGKSSFINALVGEEIAAVEAKPTTAVVTKLCYGSQDKLFLHFRDGKVQSATPQEFSRMTAVNDEAQLNEIHDKLDYVERQMPIAILKEVSIIDSPGLNDVVEKHSEATERFVSKADTVLWMFSTVQLATREEMAAMDKLTPRLKPIAVVNKMDLIDEEEDDPQEFLAKAKETLKDRVQAVVGISAKYELEGKQENNALKREIGNFAELEKTVAELVLPHREKFKLNTLLDELGSYFDAVNYDFAQMKQENEANKSSNYALYIQNEEKFMQVENILQEVVGGILDYCEREAGRNNEQALFLLGVLYESGIGVLQDTDKALQFYQKAAMKNHQNAMVDLYVYYRDHSADETANYWLKKLAEQGLSDAQNAYADTLSDAKQAFAWYEKAAKQGLAVAQTHLVECYVHGIGVNTDYEVAKQWCEKAVEQNYSVAQYFMAEYFAKTPVEKYFLYFKAAEQGYAKAQNIVGRYVEEGWAGVTKNAEIAVEWYRKAAEQGYDVAQYNLAMCLENGDGCVVNMNESVKWYREAGKQGHADAQYRLARVLFGGCGYQENKAEAFGWYKKAAEQNIVIAQTMVGLYLEEGWGDVEKNEEEAVEWYRKAAEQGYDVAQNNLGNCLYNGRGCEKNEEEAVKWYRKAAEQGNACAQYSLADCLFYGWGCKENAVEAFGWYKKAAEQGHINAQNSLACRLFEGDGCSKNKEEAVVWLRKAAKQGQANAQDSLAYCLTYGEGCQKNLEEAVQWYRYAAEQGHPSAQNSLALCLGEGRGCNVDKEEAFKWYKKAAEQGYAPAQSNLAICLEYGEGCSVNEEAAEFWYRKAADQGHEAAQKALERIRNSSSSTSTQVAAQSSGCLLPILVTFAVIIAIAAL